MRLARSKRALHAAELGFHNLRAVIDLAGAFAGRARRFALIARSRRRNAHPRAEIFPPSGVRAWCEGISSDDDRAANERAQKRNSRFHGLRV